MASDSDNDFHSAPSSPCPSVPVAARPSLPAAEQSVEFSGDEEELDASVFQAVVQELISDLSSQEKRLDSQPPPAQSTPEAIASPASSDSSSSRCSSSQSSPDYLPPATQRNLSAGAASQASRLFGRSLAPSDVVVERKVGKRVAQEDPLSDALRASDDSDEDPMSQLYLDQCCGWFKRETRSTAPCAVRSLYPAMEQGKRVKKRKLLAPSAKE